MAKKKKLPKEKNKETELPPEIADAENTGKTESIAKKEKVIETVAKPKTPKNCECRKIGRRWYCMKQDHMGHLVLCDGPFETKSECDELAVCDE